MKFDNFPQRCQTLLSQLSYSLFLSSVLLTAVPANAANFESWRFDANQNQLEFSTDGEVQPEAQLMYEPTRLVIDLPGVVLGRPAIQEMYGGAIRSVRIGQFDRERTRVVVEIAPGYTLDPNQIQFRGISPQQWVVNLPKPQPLNQESQAAIIQTNSSPLSPQTTSSITSPPTFQQPTTRSVSQTATIEAIEIGGDNQLLIRTSQVVQYKSRWDRNSGEFRIEIAPAQLTNRFQGPKLGIDSPLRRIRLRQENPQTVAVLVQPASGTQVGSVSQISQRLVTLQLLRSRPLERAIIAPIVQKQIPLGQTSSPNINSAIPSVLQTPNGRVVVIIDPGHGGPDPGAVGVGGMQEKEIVLDIGTKVAGFLQQQGVQAYLTRADDRDLDLEPRVQMAEQAQATVFVSIHANSIDLNRPDVNGLETYYFQSGADLAQMIHQTVLQTTGASDRGVRTARFYVLRKTSMPSVLVEVGFVTGREDAARLSNSSYRTQMADAIARGILQYLQRTAKL